GREGRRGGARHLREAAQGALPRALAVRALTSHADPRARELAAGGRVHLRTGISHLPDLRRYLEADAIRLDKLPADPRRDERLAWQVGDLTQHWEARRAKLSARRRADPDVREIDWLLEEFRVSLFAQTLGTKQTVSDKRIRSAIAAL